jgi:outer membrane protein TolC
MNLASMLAPVALALVIGAGRAASGEGPQVNLDEAVRQTLKNNFDIAIERVSVKSATADVQIAQSEFGPSFNASAGLSGNRSPGSSAFADPVTETSGLNGGVDVSGKIFSGAVYTLGAAAGQTKTNSTFQSLDPAYNSALSLQVTQPLLKNAGRKANMWRVETSLAAQALAENSVKAKIGVAITSAVTAYWDLVYATENLGTSGELLGWAREFERKVRLQVEAGSLPPIEIVSAQASVASAEEAVVAAKNQMEQKADNLVAIMNPPAQSPLWSAPVHPAPIPDGVPSAPPEKDYAAMALAARPELAMARMDIEAKNVELVYQENQKLPSLDVTATLRLNGLRGGAKPVVDVKTGQTVTSALDGAFPDSLRDATSGGYYDYSLGLKFSYPLDNRGAEGRYAKSAFALETAVIKLSSLERSVANEARAAHRDVVNGLKTLQAAAASRALAEKRLEAETQKFGAGSSTTFNVLQFQKDLAAQKAVELRAVADLMIAKANLAKAVGRSLEALGLTLEAAEGR